MRNLLYRQFFEALIKLQRDNQILFDANKEPIFIEIENQQNEHISNTKIGYNVSKKKYNVFSETHNITNGDWDPKMSEVVDFINYFQDIEIMLALENYDEKIHSLFRSFDAKTLINKFSQVLELMKKSTLNPKPILFIGNEQIYFDSEFQIETTSEIKKFEVSNLIQYLEDKTFLDVFMGLNDIWKMLN